jgi:hypothetical protein
MNTNSTSSSTRISTLILIAISLVTVFQIIRISAIFMIKDINAGLTPVEWLFPAMTDVFVGAIAVFIAIGLWRGKGLFVWTATIVFFVISITDHLDAIVTVLNTKGPLPTMMNGAPTSTAMSLAVMILVEMVALWGVTRLSIRNRYLAATTKN